MITNAFYIDMAAFIVVIGWASFDASYRFQYEEGETAIQGRWRYIGEHKHLTLLWVILLLLLVVFVAV